MSEMITNEFLRRLKDEWFSEESPAIRYITSTSGDYWKTAYTNAWTRENPHLKISYESASEKVEKRKANQTAISLGAEELKNVENELFDGL